MSSESCPHFSGRFFRGRRQYAVGSQHEKGEFWQERFFDHALRTVKDYGETVEYIHLNPVIRSLVKWSEEWNWSGFPEYADVDAAQQQSRCGLTIDRLRLPADEKARI